MAAIGVSGVRWSGLFWRTLEPHRNKEYYRALRERLLEFVRRKTGDNGPACGRDAPFGPTNRPLRGIWHFAIQRTPDIVVFYTIDGGTLNLALWGSHHDYPYNGKNLSAAQRTSRRVRNAVASEDVKSPRWDTPLRWRSPDDLLLHPDLAEASPQALDAAIAGLEDEMRTGGRYLALHGVPIEETTDTEFDRYLADIARAHDLVSDIREHDMGAAYWLERGPAAAAMLR